jgi:hypothetical protein
MYSWKVEATCEFAKVVLQRELAGVKIAHGMK